MRRHKNKKGVPEHIESVIYSAMMYCLYLELEDNKGVLEDVYSWCNPKLEYVSTEILQKIYDECAPRKKNSELWAKMLRHIVVILENREAGEGEKTDDEMCVQSDIAPTEG